MDAIKGALVSKTVWFNGVMTVLGAIDWINGHNILIGALIPNSGPLLAIIGAVGIILRTLTTGSLSDKVAEQ